MGNTKKITLSGLFIALGMVLPFFTGQIPEIGSMLLPMHIPVLICGYVCGWQNGLLVGAILPLLRSIIFGMPPMFPKALAMAFELAVYGAMTGILYRKLPKNTLGIYISLLGSMLAGRMVWGMAAIPIYGLTGTELGIKIFLAGAFMEAIPGIVLQLILVPLVVMGLGKTGIMSTEYRT